MEAQTIPEYLILTRTFKVSHTTLYILGKVLNCANFQIHMTKDLQNFYTYICYISVNVMIKITNASHHRLCYGSGNFTNILKSPDSQGCPCRICSKQSGTAAGFPLSTLIFPY
jgi:hypothetical protein